MNELLLEMLFDPEVSPRVSAPMKEAIIDIFVRTAADDEVRLMRAGARGVIDDLFNLSKKILRLSTSPTEQNIIAQNDIEKINLCKTALVAIKISAKTSFDLIDEELMRNVKMVTKSKACRS